MNIKNRIIFVLLFIFICLVLVKIIVLDYSPATILPETGYRLSIDMEVVGHGSEINVRASLPKSSNRQTIFNEQSEPGKFNFSVYNTNGNRFGNWQQNSVNDKQKFSYSFDVKSKKVKYLLPDRMPIAINYNKHVTKYFKETELIQVGSDEIINALNELGLSKKSSLTESLNKVFKYTSEQIRTTGFSGKTDAITTLRLREASCNGKSRLFVAMMRTLGIPARLVGGIIMNPGSKRISHQWLEVFINDQWVPMDPTNNHFAEIPRNYLIFYYGDEAFFKRTSNVNFKYTFNIENETYPRESDYSNLAAHPLNIMNAWSLFSKAGLSMELLKIILMIPIGAVVTIIFRNVIGIQTFGTFLPVLIASSFRASGLMWGMIAFSSIIIIGSLLRWIIDRLRITHTPKLTILLVFVVFSLLTISALGVFFNNMNLAKATLFPLALMAITIERFALISQENGTKDALKIYANTAVTVMFCYVVINSLFLQTFVLAFPEIMLLVICAGIYFGNWIGLRVTELVRFKHLIFAKQVD